jgi:hypothetical protein
MANESSGKPPVAGSVGKGSTPTQTSGNKRARKVYEHEMTEQEKFALQIVQRAQSALRTVNDAIKSGRQVKPEVIKMAHQFVGASVDMLF